MRSSWIAPSAEVIMMQLSRGDLLVLVALLAVFGLADSAYLTWEWYGSEGAPWCDLNAYFSCSRVRESPYATVAGVPTAWIGVLGFAVLFLVAFLGLRADSLGPWPPERWLLGFSIVGAVLGLGLTVIEIAVIQAICVLCLFGFALDLGILTTAALIPPTR